MPSNNANSGGDAYHGGYDAATSGPTPQNTYGMLRDNVLSLQGDLQMQEMQMEVMMERVQAMVNEANNLRYQYDEVVNERIYLVGLATEAEKRVEDVKKTLEGYANVKDAVVASDGYTYEREQISQYIERCKAEGNTPTSYQTDEPITSLLVPNRSLKTLVERLVTLQKTDPAPASDAAAAGGNASAAHSKPSGGAQRGGGGQNGNASGEGQSRDLGKAVEVNAKGERVHPCIRVYGFCNYNGNCAYAMYPYSACLSNLKGKCRFRNQCHERHVEFRGPLDENGVPLSEAASPSQAEKPAQSEDVAEKCATVDGVKA